MLQIVFAGRGRFGLLGLVTALVGCPASEVFTCADDSECQGDGLGRCEANGFCSFPDQQCPSGRRYGELAGGGFASDCVDAEVGSTGSQDTGESSAATGSSSGTGDALDGGSTTMAEPPGCELVSEMFRGGTVDPRWEVEVGEPQISIEDGYAQWTVLADHPQTYRGIRWDEPIPRDGSSVTLGIRQPPTDDANELRIDLQDANGCFVSWLWDVGELQAETSGCAFVTDDLLGAVPFDAVDDRFLRIREDGGLLRFESSPDGESFVPHFSVESTALAVEFTVAVAVQAQPGQGDIIQVDLVEICAP